MMLVFRSFHYFLRDFAAMTHSAPNVLERFLHYVQFDTQSDETSAAAPSTVKQLKLAEALKDRKSVV